MTYHPTKNISPSKKKEAKEMDYGGMESDEAAAWILVWMKQSKLDKETAEEMKRNVCQRVKDESRVLFQESQTRMINKLKRSRKMNIGVVSKETRISIEPAASLVLPARPPFPELQELIGSCGKPFQKTITKSDVKKHLSRYMLNGPFFEAHLKPMIDTNVETIKDGIPVTLYGPGGRGYDMTLKNWCEKYYVLNGTTWIRFCQDYHLESFIHHRATIWMFRHSKTNKLCFAITWSN